MALVSHPSRLQGDELDTPSTEKSIAENYSVSYRGKSVQIAKLMLRERLAARDVLESALEDGNFTSIAGGEAAVRKMLRALSYAIGPNTDRKKALQWRTLAILAADVQVDWTDGKGDRHAFRSQIADLSQWREWIEREMQRLSDIVFEKSMGKINMVPEVLVSRARLTYLRQSRGRYWCTAAGAKPVIDDVGGKRRPLSIFVWIPKEGSGKFPPCLGAAHVARPERATRNAILTIVYSSEERMQKVGGWASPGGAGILHEFWHNVENAMRRMLGFKGFVPSNHSDEHFNMLKAEYREQGLTPPGVRYDALLCSYPTWRMCHTLAQATEHSHARKSKKRYRIKAYIDGSCTLVLKNGSACWHNHRGAVPGRHGGHNYPTYINGKSWRPKWPENRRDGEVQSETLRTHSLEVPPAAKTAKIISRAKGARDRRGRRIVDAEVAFGVLKIHFRDMGHGASWYDITVQVE